MTHHSSHLLVTGATGFVGRAFISHAAMPGTRVSAIGRSHQRLAAAFGNIPGVSCFAYDDTTSGNNELAQAISAAIDAGPVGAQVTLVHLAGAAHDSRLSDEFRGAAIDSITDHLVSALVDGPSARVINVSSIAARPDQCGTGARLEHYGRAKARSEVLLAGATDMLDGGCISLRPPAVWGPTAPGSFRTVRRLLDWRLPLPVGGIRARRAYLHIDRLTDVLRTLATSQWPPRCSEIFELADPASYTLSEIFAAVAAEYGREFRSFPVPEPIIRAVLNLLRKPDLVDQFSKPLEVTSDNLAAFLLSINRNSSRP